MMSDMAHLLTVDHRRDRSPRHAARQADSGQQLATSTEHARAPIERLPCLSLNVCRSCD